MRHPLPSQAVRAMPGLLAAATLLAAGAPSAIAQQTQRPVLTPGNPAGPVSYSGRWANHPQVALRSLRSMYVTRRGQAAGPLPGSPLDGCTQTSTYTDANWEGGSYTVQAGFAEGESAAASYVLSASDFPLRLDTAEIIFACSNTNQTTTTQWSVQVWQGLPGTGTLVAEESSDGSILPHVVMPPGTNGVHVVFQVDPGDPQQIIVQDDGSHTFSIAFRIDEHNNGPANPCFTSPPTNSNAFPVTDVSGLASATGNWLNGLNCGSLGCPPNGGWARFSQLAQFCRPSGDWVLRATWTPQNCAATGACCVGGQCQVLTQAACLSQSGIYRGDNSPCAASTCTGACCFGANCLNFSSADCAAASGSFQGIGTVCGSGNACPTGACCYADGTCAAVTSAACTSQGGTFRGVNSSCATANCPLPPGACCLPSGVCFNLTQTDCALIPGSWRGPGTLCSTAGICTQPCYPNCDASTTQPILNVLDFNCFLNRFSAGASYANCDNSTQAPVLNVLDFNCFLNRFSAGCP